MSEVFEFVAGTAPLLISIPHDGRRLPRMLEPRMTQHGLALPDTDWYVGRLYSMAGRFEASIISANYSRYVVDLNRADSDDALYPGQLSTGLVPTQTFAGERIYRAGEVPDAAEQQRRVDDFWRPYHRKLAETVAAMRARHGYALLWDAHSIRARVPSLFTGTLPDLNVGTNDGRSCAPAIEAAVTAVAEASAYSTVLNGRFKGGFITRHYGAPAEHVHAIQLELAQRCYMDEETLHYEDAAATRLAATIGEMLETFLATAAGVYGR